MSQIKILNFSVQVVTHICLSNSGSSPDNPFIRYYDIRFNGADDLKWTYCEVLSGETILRISCVQITFNIVLMIIKKWLAILKEKNEV